MEKYFFSIFILILTIPGLSAAQLSSQNVNIVAGENGQVNISYDAGGNQFTGFLFDIKYDHTALTLTATAGSAATSAGKQLSNSNPVPGTLRCLIWGVNTDSVESGTLVTVTVTVSASTDPGDYTLQLASATATDSSSQEVSLTTQDGKVTVSSSEIYAYTTDGSSVWTITDDVYRMNGKGDRQQHFLYFDQNLCGFDFQVDTRKIQGDRDGYSHSYGVLFRGQNDQIDSAYFFLVVKTGQYWVGKYVDGKRTTLNDDWTITSALKTGFGTWNTIGVSATGGSFILSANGTQLITINDDSFACGEVGLIAFDHDEATVPDTVEFKNVRISSDSNNTVLWFPQYVNGATTGYLNKTRIILRNNSSQTDSGEIIFRDSDGNLANIPVGGTQVSKSSFSLPAWGTTEIVTDGTGAFVVGAIEVNSDNGAASKLEGTEVFELEGNSVSVNSSSMASSQQVYVSVNDLENTGFAAYNPDPKNSITLTVYLLDHNGIQIGNTTVSLAPNQQLARFVNQDELFKTYFDNHSGDFNGTLNIHVNGSKPVALLGILLRSDSGALIAVAPSTNVFRP